MCVGSWTSPHNYFLFVSRKIPMPDFTIATRGKYQDSNKEQTRGRVFLQCGLSFLRASVICVKPGWRESACGSSWGIQRSPAMLTSGTHGGNAALSWLGQVQKDWLACSSGFAPVVCWSLFLYVKFSKLNISNYHYSIMLFLWGV